MAVDNGTYLLGCYDGDSYRDGSKDHRQLLPVRRPRTMRFHRISSTDAWSRRHLTTYLQYLATFSDIFASTTSTADLGITKLLDGWTRSSATSTNNTTQIIKSLTH